jgi:hypothetical protein
MDMVDKALKPLNVVVAADKAARVAAVSSRLHISKEHLRKWQITHRTKQSVMIRSLTERSIMISCLLVLFRTGVLNGFMDLLVGDLRVVAVSGQFLQV